jgi:hypothetical protein
MQSDSFPPSKCCTSTDNMIKQWHSIQGVWDLMESCSPAPTVTNGTNGPVTTPYYKRIGLFRLDVFYPEPISIADSQEVAVVPRFMWPGYRPGYFLYNDRMFFGSYNNSRVWATHRFNYAPIYTATWKDGPSFLQGINSESFVARMLHHFHVKPEKKDICFWRIRTTGYVTTSDCQARPYQYLSEFVMNTSSLDEENREWLTGLTCESAVMVGTPCLPEEL